MNLFQIEKDSSWWQEDPALVGRSLPSRSLIQQRDHRKDQIWLRIYHKIKMKFSAAVLASIVASAAAGRRLNGKKDMVSIESMRDDEKSELRKFWFSIIWFFSIFEQKDEDVVRIKILCYYLWRRITKNQMPSLSSDQFAHFFITLLIQYFMANEDYQKHYLVS